MIKIGALPFDTPKNIPRSLQFTYKSSRGFVNEISPKNFPPFFVLALKVTGNEKAYWLKP
jgi:hypothetical protein